MSLDSPKIPIAPVFLASNTNLFTIRRHKHTNFPQSPALLRLSTEIICGCHHGCGHGVRTNRLDHRLLPTGTMKALNECFHNVLLLAKPFWLRKITTDPHILTHVNTVRPYDSYPKLKIYISELILDSIPAPIL
jgi:hypothetical protein